jgi:hypothetical protein
MGVTPGRWVASKTEASGPDGLERVRGFVTACAGCTWPLAMVRQLHCRGWTGAQRSGMTGQGTDGLGLGPGDLGVGGKPCVKQ